MPMILNLLHIRKHYDYSDKKGYYGEVKFEGDDGEMSLNFDAELANVILRACSKELVAASKRRAADLAASMEKQIIEATTAPAIEHQEIEDEGDSQEEDTENN